MNKLEGWLTGWVSAVGKVELRQAGEDKKGHKSHKPNNTRLYNGYVQNKHCEKYLICLLWI